MIQDLIIIVILGIIVTLFYTIIDKNTNLQSGCPNWQGDGLQNRFVWVRVPLLTLIASQCNGSTTEFDSVSLGSSPDEATISRNTTEG